MYIDISVFIFRRGRRLHLAAASKRAPLGSTDMTQASCRYCAIYGLAEESDCLYGVGNIQQSCLGAFVSAVERMVENNQMEEAILRPNLPSTPLEIA